MCDVKDPAIKLFGSTILAADEVSGGSGSGPPPDLPVEEPDKVRATPIIPFLYLGSSMSC
jgi:hypothetical protein